MNPIPYPFPETRKEFLVNCGRESPPVQVFPATQRNTDGVEEKGN